MKKHSSKFMLMTGNELWEFLSEKSASFREAYIMSPFISKSGWQKIADLIDANPRKIQLNLITRKDLLSLVLQHLDLGVIKDILQRKEQARYNSTFDLRWVPDLHAKMYLFKPLNICVIGSSNLSNAGFGDNGKEMNVVWENSPTMFREIYQKFLIYWNASQVEKFTWVRYEQMQRTIALPRFQNLKNSLELLRSRQSTLPEFTRQGKEHKSAQNLKKIANYVKKHPTWQSLKKHLSKISKATSVENKIYFLIQNEFLEVIDQGKLGVSEKGWNILKEKQNMFDWLCNIEPNISVVFQWINANPYSTYDQIDLAIDSVDRRQIERIVRWCVSMNLIGFADKNRFRKWYTTDQANTIQIPKTT